MRKLLAGRCAVVEAIEHADTRAVQLTAMTWNLFHGRDWPPEPELQVRAHKGNFRRGPRLGKDYEQVNWDLFDEFAALIDSVDWDVALLPGVPAELEEPAGRGLRRRRLTARSAAGTGCSRSPR